MKAAFYTLGCKVNQYDTQEMMSSLRERGFEIVDSKEKADIYVINSCTVTSESSRKTRQAVRRFKNEVPEATVVLTGCYPQAFPREAAALNEADIVLGNKTNSSLYAEIEKYAAEKQKSVNVLTHEIGDKYTGAPISSFDGHTRAFVKIQDGCNRYCTYCIIPKSRGFSRSKSLKEIRYEVRELAEKGYREIVFVGINLSSYGCDIGCDICDALLIAEQTQGIERIRLGSLEPDHITDDMIKKLSKVSKLCPQFHLSLQSGSDVILKKMNRHYTTEEYYELCIKLKTAFPGLSLTTDIIVGFPGETQENFRETLDFVKKCGFIKVHVFPFSPRRGTPAYLYPRKISNAEKAARCACLSHLCGAIRKDYLVSLIGKRVSVLFEMPKGCTQSGYTENYTPVSVENREDLSGKILNVKIIGIDSCGCLGILEE